MNDTLLTLLVLLETGALLILVVYLTRRREPDRNGPPAREFQPDLANMMILFQTMRDIVQQQKELARQFNESLDKKVSAIRQAASVAMENLERLREAERRTLAQLTELREELASLQRQAVYLRESTQSNGRTGAPSGPAPASPLSPEERSDAEALAPLVEPPTPEGVEPDPQDLIDNWVGFDFHDEALASTPEDGSPADEGEEEPPDADEQHDTFRVLLNLDEAPHAEENAPLPQGGNGQAEPDVDAGLKARVYEYRDAGMTTTQIAQELGIGKGEVRLILNLRKRKRT